MNAKTIKSMHISIKEGRLHLDSYPRNKGVEVLNADPNYLYIGLNSKYWLGHIPGSGLYNMRDDKLYFYKGDRTITINLPYRKISMKGMRIK